MAITRPINEPFRSPRSVAVQLLIAGLLLAPVLFYLTGFRWVISLAWFAGIGAVLLLAFPRAAFVVFIVSLGFYFRARVGPMMVTPADLAAFFVIAGIFLEFLLRGYTRIRWTRFDVAFFGIILATLLSIPLAVDISYTVVPTLRILVIYLSFRFVFKLAQEIGVRRVALGYIYFIAVLSAYNWYLFVAAGGAHRVFGYSRLAFETYSMTALPMAVAFLIWSNNNRERLRLVLAALLIAVALAATQSRAPLVAVIVSLPVLLLFAVSKRRREGHPLRLSRAAQLFTAVAIAVAVLLTIEEGLFVGWYERVERLVLSVFSPQGTIALRIVLWTAAIKAFLSNPITGIGIGNFKVVEQIVPEVELVPVWYYIGGHSAHNVILQYLAETGLIGALSLIALAWVGLRSSFRLFRQPQTDHDAQVSAALFIGMFIFAFTMLYVRAWTWGLDSYILSLLFGLNAAWQWRAQQSPWARST